MLLSTPAPDAPRCRRFIFTTAFTILTFAVLAVPAAAALTFVSKPVACSVGTTSVDATTCEPMYDTTPTAADVGTSYPAGRRTSAQLVMYPGVVRVLYDAPQTFNTLCFQQPPGQTTWNLPFQPIVSTIEVWPGESMASAAPAVILASTDSTLRCYALSTVMTSQTVTFRLALDSHSNGDATVATLLMAYDTAWEAATNVPPQTAQLPSSMPVPASHVRAIHRATDCDSKASLFPNFDNSCRGAIDATPSLTDVNTGFAAGLPLMWIADARAQTPMYITMAQESFVNGICFQQMNFNRQGPAELDTTGRIDVWRGRVTALDTTPPDATVQIPRAAGHALLCYRLLTNAGTEVNFTTTDVTFRAWRALGMYGTHGAATLLAADISSTPQARPAPSPPTGGIVPPSAGPGSAATTPNSDGSSDNSDTVVIVIVACSAFVVVAIVAAVACVAARCGSKSPPEEVGGGAAAVPVEGIAVSGVTGQQQHGASSQPSAAYPYPAAAGGTHDVQPVADAQDTPPYGNPGQYGYGYGHGYNYDPKK